mmetsp:Transcript_59714/g.172327  ORF Transcript_59714/g.172327 Transcript_59714/m.172327 type:complete len:274 (+) Transcript_59714:567-1388(+)
MPADGVADEVIREAADEELIRHEAGGPDVGLLAADPALPHLRRDVHRVASDLGLPAPAGLLRFARTPEAADLCMATSLRVAVAHDPDVLRPEVAVDEAGLLQLEQAAQDLDEHAHLTSTRHATAVRGQKHLLEVEVRGLHEEEHRARIGWDLAKRERRAVAVGCNPEKRQHIPAAASAQHTELVPDGPAPLRRARFYDHHLDAPAAAPQAAEEPSITERAAAASLLKTLDDTAQHAHPWRLHLDRSLGEIPIEVLLKEAPWLPIRNLHVLHLL